jgi:carotenoid cleavage dioxygenase-like enzyme
MGFGEGHMGRQSFLDPRINRRAFLRGASLLAAGAAAPSWLAACGGSSSSAPQQSAVALTVDPRRPWWLQNNFDPVFDELDVANLEVRGRIPSGLNGTYVRNGSNAQNANNEHWFVGDGMLHGVRLRNGRAEWYRNRYIRTPLYEQGLTIAEAGLPLEGNNQSNVSPIYHAGRLLTSGEIGFPYQIDPADLSTVGVYSFDGGLNTSFTAHSKIDPATGYLHFFGYWFGPPYLTYHVADASGALIYSDEVVVGLSSMIHSFAITDRDVIFWEFPVLFDPTGFDVHGFPFLWHEDYGARIGIMPLGGPTSAIRWVEVEPGYVFHELNAFRDGADVVVDVCRYERMMDAERFGSFPPHLHRWRINTAGTELTFSDEVIDDSMRREFPMRDPRFVGRPHGWFVDVPDHPDTIDPRGIAHFDYQRGLWRMWKPGLNQHCGEALFVPGGSGEGEGWLLTFAYDHASDASELIILEALDIEAGPLARISMPRRVPHGFHGTWVPA